MAYESVGTDLGFFTAAADLSAKQYYFVKLASSTTVNVCAAVTDKPIGVLQNKPESGEQAIVRVFGVSKISADATLAAGDVIGTSADGQAQPISLGSETTVHVCGQAIEAGAAGNILAAYINVTNGRGA
tara:strand:+ start:328 stop:714 length:387 start_codon:yes stop_codon:yes gene_type:complete